VETLLEMELLAFKRSDKQTDKFGHSLLFFLNTRLYSLCSYPSRSFSCSARCYIPPYLLPPSSLSLCIYIQTLLSPLLSSPKNSHVSFNLKLPFALTIHTDSCTFSMIFYIYNIHEVYLPRTLMIMFPLKRTPLVLHQRIYLSIYTLAINVLVHCCLFVLFRLPFDNYFLLFFAM
jgi:hypothetical protein